MSSTPPPRTSRKGHPPPASCRPPPRSWSPSSRRRRRHPQPPRYARHGGRRRRPRYPAKDAATGRARAGRTTHHGRVDRPGVLGSSDGVRGAWDTLSPPREAPSSSPAPRRAFGAGAAHVFTRSSRDDDEPVDGGATSRGPRRIHRGRRARRGRRGAPGRGRRGETDGSSSRARANAAPRRRTPSLLPAHGRGRRRRARLGARPGVDQPDAPAPGGFGASLALTGRYLLVACDPAPGSTGAGTTQVRAIRWRGARRLIFPRRRPPMPRHTRPRRTRDGGCAGRGVDAAAPRPRGSPRRRPAARARYRGRAAMGSTGGGGWIRRRRDVEETDGRRERGETVEVSDAIDAGDVGNHDCRGTVDAWRSTALVSLARRRIGWV